MKDKKESLRALGLTDAEIADVIASDLAIDRGEKLFELDPELAVGAKKARQADRKQSAPVKRERKTDEVKAGLIELLTNAIEEQPMCNSLTIINSEREFEFMWAGKRYKIVLSAPRS